MYEENFPEKRYRRTLEFLQKAVPPPARVLDLGVKNPMSQRMAQLGYEVTNTSGEDLDLDSRVAKESDAHLVTAFEIFEHLLAPLNVLREIKVEKLVATIPLKLWFSPAYRSKTDPWDRHFHEFEDWQFDWMLEKAGWKIQAREKWTNPVKKIGLRPLLRNFIPRYYAVYATR